MRSIYIAPLLLAVLAFGTVSVAGSTQISATFPLRAHGNFTTTTSGCDNSPGPFITMTGDISLSGVGMRLIFQNNAKGTHTHIEQTNVDVTVLPAGETISFAKQPPLGGVGGNPWIFLQLLDSNGNPVSDEILLGRCVQGLFNTSIGFAILAAALGEVFVQGCSNKGPEITLSGEVSLTGINAKFIFRNNERGTHEREEPTSVSIIIIPAGQSITFPKQPVLGGVGGNPWIYAQFLDSDGKPVGTKVLLGRCVQLSQN